MEENRTPEQEEGLVLPERDPIPQEPLAEEVPLPVIEDLSYESAGAEADHPDAVPAEEAIPEEKEADSQEAAEESPVEDSPAEESAVETWRS